MGEALTDLQKKKKTRFPISRIRKLIQLNENVGKATAAVPVVLSKALELFLSDLSKKLMAAAEQHKTTKIVPAHFEEVLAENEELYGFLKSVGKAEEIE